LSVRLAWVSGNQGLGLKSQGNIPRKFGPVVFGDDEVVAALLQELLAPAGLGV
jgi:hypothetical protein